MQPTNDEGSTGNSGIKFSVLLLERLYQRNTTVANGNNFFCSPT